MNDQKKKTLQDWYRKRKLTTISGILLKCIFSFEYSSIVISALYYFKYTFNPFNDKLLYSLTLGFMYFTASVAAGITGRYLDQTRNLRKIVIMALLLSVVGNFMYALPVLIWFPVIARGLCGIADSIQPAIAGELSRCYSEEKFGSVLKVYYVLSTIVFAVAPCSLVLFKYINFTIGSFVINQYNFIGIFQAGLNVLAMVFAYFAVFDLTKDPGYVLFLKEAKMASPNSHSLKENVKTGKFNEDTSKLLSVKNVFDDGILVILISGSSALEYLNSQLQTIIVFVAVYNFSWSINRTSILAVIGMLVNSTVALLSGSYVKGARAIYYMFVLCFIAGWISICMLLYSIHSSPQNAEMKVLLFEESLLSFGSVAVGANTYGRWLQFSLVSSNCRSFMDAVRHISAKIFCCIGFFTAAFVYDFSSVILPILAIVCFLHTVLLLVKRDDYFRAQKKGECVFSQSRG